LTLGPMDWHKALEIAIAVSHGLAAAHAKGITHRDIKPANIFLTAANVKILDFGIALICAPSPPQPEPGNTIPSAVTRPGFAVGTVGYMAPERLRGGAVGPSSDIFSLGCVLHEMVTGNRAFGGATAADTVASVLTLDPSPLLDGPAELEELVAHCLR